MSRSKNKRGRNRTPSAVPSSQKQPAIAKQTVASSPQAVAGSDPTFSPATPGDAPGGTPGRVGAGDRGREHVETFLIEPRDPLIARDARPFSAEPGARAFSLPWLLPRTMAGAMRTSLGNTRLKGARWEHQDAIDARKVAVHGPVLVARATTGDAWEPYLPVPRDVVFFHPEDDVEEKRLRVIALRPAVPEVVGADMTRPLPPPGSDDYKGFARAWQRTQVFPLSVDQDAKPAKDLPVWWRLEDVVKWLSVRQSYASDADLDPSINSSLPLTGSQKDIAVRGLRALSKDARTHVGIDAASQTHLEGALFTTEGLAFSDGYVDAEARAPHASAMLVRVGSPKPCRTHPPLIQIGGERRVSMMSSAAEHGIIWPEVPDVPPGWSEANGLRLYFATPALFSHGWIPNWLESGVIPGLGGFGLRLRLVGAAIDRPVPVSGYRLSRTRRTSSPTGSGEQADLDELPDTTPGKFQERGPRPTAYAVPAGSVYFFAVERGSLTDDMWEKLWLQPLSDREADCDEGFGLVIPGIWDATHVLGQLTPLPDEENV